MYERTGNMEAFFRPVMAEAHNDTRPLCAIDIGASSGAHGEWICIRPCKVKTLLFHLSIEAASGTSVAPTVVFYKRVTPGTSTSGSAVGTLTIPTGTALGSTVYKQITPVNFVVGDLIYLTWTIGTGTPTGIGDANAYVEPDPDVAGNNSEMIASA